MDALATLTLSMGPVDQVTSADVKKMNEEALSDELHWTLYNIEELKKIQLAAAEAGAEKTSDNLKEILKRLKKYRNKLIDAMHARALLALNNMPLSDSAGYEACSDW